MVELLRIALASATGWFTVRSAYLLLSPGFVERRPVLTASMVGGMVGLTIPAVLTAMSNLLLK
jgi:hypothetical protein